MTALRSVARAGKARAIMALAVSGAIALSACTSSSTASPKTGQPSASGKVGEVLTVALPTAPPTLDPAKSAPNFSPFEMLAYEPLIVSSPNGTLGPGLATSWQYGNGNKTLSLQLRSGVSFSDGNPLTAQAVVDHFRYIVKAAAAPAGILAGDTFSVADPHTVKITFATPSPDFLTLLTQNYVQGDVISPAGTNNPTALGTQTFGAGPYMLSSAGTVAGSRYTYVPNPRYYDKAAVHWKKVVLEVIANPQSALNAVKTGQVDLAVGTQDTLAAAHSTGLTVTGVPSNWVGMTLADRGGKLVKALSDVRVRQALNYATDRKTVASAIYRTSGSDSLGQATSQISVPGAYGYVPSLESAYPYNPSKAKQLLTAAGYPNGFTLKIVTGETVGMNLVAQALQQQWAKIGVRLQITDYANATQYTSDAFGGKFAAFMTGYGVLPLGIEGISLFGPKAVYNPFHTSDPQLQSLFARDQAASGAAKTKLDGQIVSRLSQQAWFVPVAATGVPWYATTHITGTTVSAKSPNPSLYEVQPAA